MTVVLPILVPLVTAIGCLLLWNRPSWQRRIASAGALGLLGAGAHLLWRVATSGIAVVQIGGWPAPYGITLVADLFSAIMVLLAGITAFTVGLFAAVTIDAERERFGFHPMFHLLLVGVCGAFLTGDLFNLYVWFEVMLMASFVLLALGGERAQLEGAIKYVTLNLISSAFFLAGVGLTYGFAGTLNMADLSGRLAAAPETGFVTTLAMLFLLAFGLKAAAFPLFFWLPASYHTPPVAVSAIFAGLLTKVGVYALIRTFTLLFVQDVGFTHGLILLVASLTMITGVLGALAQNEFRRILSFHIVSQIGYMLMGLGLFTPLALAGSIFYIVHHIIVKTGLFLVSGVANRLRGTFELARLGGLQAERPLLAVLFLLPALSLAGLPPSSGFFAKLSLVRAGLAEREHTVVALALFVGLITLLSMTKIWQEAFWKPRPSDSSEGRERLPVWRGSLATGLAPIALLVALSVALGLYGAPVYGLASRAAEQLLDRQGYVQAVLGGGS